MQIKISLKIIEPISQQVKSQVNKFQLKLKGVLNPNFRPFNFELKKNGFFGINFDLGFKVL